MQKTAMQRLVGIIQNLQDDNFNSDLEYVKQDAEKLLEEEKNQILHAFQAGSGSDDIVIYMEKTYGL